MGESTEGIFPGGGMSNFLASRGDSTPIPSVGKTLECFIQLAVRSGEHIIILPLTNKRAQPTMNCAVCHYLLKQ